MSKEDVRKLLEIILQSTQALRIQQSQLLAESTWDQEHYGERARKAYQQFNEAHQQLWIGLLGEDEA